MSRPQVHETARSLAEATASTSDESGLLEVEFITPGWGSSGYYSRQVLEAAAPLFEAGTHMYFDHPSTTERQDRPERSVRDLAAVITESAIDKTTGAITGRVKPLAAYKDLLTDETFAKNVGLSIRGSATDVVVGEAEGRTGPIIEGLAAIDSVDFVTRAGRGGRVLSVLESAGVAEATASDRHRQLVDAVRAEHGGPDIWAWVRDVDAEQTRLWFEVHTENDGSHTYEQSYTVADNDADVALVGDPIEVSRLTTYVPVNPAGRTTEESQEDTMPQIEEARLRELEEAAGRVQTLEAERDTERQGRETAERERDQLRATEAARSHARTRVTAANADLPAATVDRVVAEATRTVPLTESGDLDTAALDTAVDTARTAEESYLAGIARAAGVGTVTGFGGTSTPETDDISESDLDGVIAGAFGRQVKEA